MDEKRKPRCLRKEDKLYCGKCVYHGSFTEEYLCNFLFMTGKRRGCKAGVGCKQRVVENNEKQYDKLKCERCGAIYVGTPSTHYCMACRREAVRRNVMKAQAAKAGKRKEQN